MRSDFLEDVNNLEDSSGEVMNFADLLNLLLSKRRIFIFIFLTFFSFLSLQTIFKYIFNPVYKGDFSLLISDPLKDKQSENFGLGEQGDMISKLALNTTSNDITTLIELLKSKNIIKPVAEKYNLSLRDFSNKLKIESGGGSKRYERAEGILDISLMGPNKKKLKLILKDLSQLYLQTALKQRQRRLSDGLNFLNNQEPELRDKTIEIQNKLEKFRIKNKLIEPIDESKILKENKTILDEKRRKFLSEQNRLKRVKEEIIKGNLIATSFKENIVASSNNPNNVKGDGLVFIDSDQGLLKQYATLELKIAEASAKFTQNSKVVTSLKSKLDEIKPILLKSQLKAINNALKINKSNIQTIDTQSKKNSKEFLLKPALIKDYETLQLRLSIASENLKALVESREILQLEIAQNSFPWSVIEDPSVSKNPVEPKIPTSLFLSFIISLVASFLGVILRDRFDNVFHDSLGISRLLKLPILTQIPFNNEIYNKKIVSLKDPKKAALSESTLNNRYQRFLYLESLRELYTSLRFISTNEKDVKIFAITSAITGEGKSIITVMLAKTLVEFDLKVLVIDADLRTPSIHTKLGAPNEVGLSNLLVDNSLTYENVVQSKSEKLSFDFISGGKKSPNPPRLINSQRFKSILDDIRNSKRYDYVIFDTPPVLGIIDTPIIVSYCDFSLIVVSLDYVDKKLPLQVLSKMKKSKKPILGIISNTVKETNDLTLKKYSFGKYSYGKNEYGEKNLIKEDKEKLAAKNNLEKSINRVQILNTLYFIKLKLQRFFKWIDGN